MPATAEPIYTENPIIELLEGAEAAAASTSPPIMVPCIPMSTPTTLDLSEPRGEVDEANMGPTTAATATETTATTGRMAASDPENLIDIDPETDEETARDSSHMMLMASPSPKLSEESFIHHHHYNHPHNNSGYPIESSMSSTTSPVRRTSGGRLVWSRGRARSKLNRHPSSISEDDRDNSQYSGDRSHFSIHLPSGFSPSSVSSSPLVSMKARRQKTSFGKARYISGSKNQALPDMGNANVPSFFTNIGNGPKVLFSPTKGVVSFKTHHSPSKVGRERETHEVVSLKERNVGRNHRRIRRPYNTNSDYDSTSLPFTPENRDETPNSMCEEDCEWEDDKHFRSDQECDVHDSSISILSFSKLAASSPKPLSSITPDSKFRRYSRTSQKTESSLEFEREKDHSNHSHKYKSIYRMENLTELKHSHELPESELNHHNQHKINQHRYPPLRNSIRSRNSPAHYRNYIHHGYWFTDPNLPFILSMYFQLFFNVILSGALLYFLYAFVCTIQNDVDQRVEKYSAEVSAKMTQCLKDYTRNNCAPDQRVPALELVCQTLEKCMDRDPALVGRARISAETFAEIINSFIKPISYKAISVIFILTVGSFGVTNFGFNSFRWANRDIPENTVKT